MTDAEIDTLRLWIKQGASWALHWAYVAPKKQKAPKPSDETWALNWIDDFILTGLESADDRDAAH